MSEADPEYVEDFSQRWKEMSGYVYPQYVYFARHDPEFAEAFYTMMKTWRREYAIPLKYKEMMILLGSCVKMQEFAIRTHMRRAIELGATADELRELIEVVLLSGGGAAFVLASKVLMELTEEGVEVRGPTWA